MVHTLSSVILSERSLRSKRATRKLLEFHNTTKLHYVLHTVNLLATLSLINLTFTRKILEGFTTKIAVTLSIYAIATHAKAGLTGLEPATSCVTGRHSNQLNYSPSCALFKALN